MTTIAVLGMGAMGSRLAANFLQAGHSLVVYNRTAAKAKPLQELGAVLAKTPKAAATQAEIVIGMVRDDRASQDLWLEDSTGALWGLEHGKVAIESSTLTVAWTKTLGIHVGRSGAAFLDAPVVGSLPQAEAKKLIYLVGGRQETLTEMQAVLAATSVAVHHVGPVGQAMSMKLAVNGLFGMQVAGLAEILAVLQGADLSSSRAMAILSELPVVSAAAKNAGNLMVQNQHNPMFPVDLVAKDFHYLLAAAGHTPTIQAVSDRFQQAIAAGYGQENITAISRLYLSNPGAEGEGPEVRVSGD